jgi:hypothetical protein
MIYAQMTAPVAVANAVAIPAGSFVQGKVEKLARNGTRAEMLLQSVSVIFPAGYVANIAGPVAIESAEGTAWKVATKGGMSGALAAPLIGGAGGAVIGHAANGSRGTTVNGLTVNPDRLQSTAIGGITGFAAGAVIGLVLLSHSRQFYVEVGSPMEMALPQPLTLVDDEISDTLRKSLSPPPPIGDAPGTPDIVIPGTPSIPGTPYPCD